MKLTTSKLIFLFFLLLCLILTATCKKLEKSMLVSTGTVGSITTNSAEASGEVIDLGEGATQYGHCYGTTPNVSTAGMKTAFSVPSIGGFTSPLTGLDPGTKYYIKAYLSNGTETVYGKEITFTTVTASPPTLSTTAITLITTTTASSGGDITDDGGSPVTARGVCWNTATGPSIANSKTTDDTGTGSFTSNLTGLTGSTTYYVRAYATNSAGTAYGNELSFTTNTVILTAPGAPTMGTATAGNTQATVTFTAPANNGGSTITGYTVTSNPGGISSGGSSSPVTVTGLTNGTSYTFTVTATNAIGTSPASSVSNSVTPSTVPGAPTGVTATPDNAQATVSFVAPVSDGGSPITGYTVTSNPGNITGTGSTSPITVTGLTNGTSYTFTVIATNTNGIGPASTASNSVIPSSSSTVPDAPTMGTATAGNTQATITFTAPANNGGSTITGYTVTSDPGNLTGTGSTSPITVTGLTNGTSYTFTVTATNSIGTSPASSVSNSVTPSTVPGAPTGVTATPDNAQATVSFTAPVSDGGSPITGYTVTSNPSGFEGFGSASPITVTGLTNGITYTFTVTATNVNGTGPSSYASNSVTPLTVPDSPTDVIATPGDTQVSVSFTAPVSDGGSAITYYTVTSSPGGFTGTGSASPIIVDGLTNGTHYTFTVNATTVYGTSPESSPSNEVTPNCPLDLDLTVGTFNAVSVDWGIDGPVTFTVDPDDQYTVFVTGLAEIEGVVEDGGPLVMHIDPLNYVVTADKSIIASDFFGYTNYAYEGTGIYDPCTSTYEMDFEITVTEGTFGINEFTFTRYQ